MTQPQEVASVNLQELEETVSRLSSHKGVEAVLILNRDGDILAEAGLASTSASSQGDENSSAAAAAPGAETASNVNKLLRTATSYIQSLSPDDQVSFLQIRSQQHRELYISPHDGYVLVVVKR